MSTRSAVQVVGFLAALIGLVFLFVPVSSPFGVDCGSVFGGGVNDENQFLYDGSLGYEAATTSCGAARTGRWQYVVPLLVLGAGVAACASVKPSSLVREDEEVDEV